MLGSKNMTKACEITYEKKDVLRLEYLIKHGYTYRLNLDGLPSASLYKLSNQKSLLKYHEGIPLGFYDEIAD